MFAYVLPMKLMMLKKQTFSVFNLLTYLHWFKIGTECWFFLRRCRKVNCTNQTIFINMHPIRIKTQITCHKPYFDIFKLSKWTPTKRVFLGQFTMVKIIVLITLGSNLGFIWNKVFILFCYSVHIADGWSETPCTCAHKYTKFYKLFEPVIVLI